MIYIMERIGVWIGAILTFAILSFLYKDNPFYKIAEQIFIGISAGYWFIYTISFVMGTTAGMSLILFLRSDIIKQTSETMMNPFSAPDLAATIGQLILIIGTLTGIIYFFFSKKHEGVFGTTARVGIYFLMVSFGAAFGYTIMARISLLIGRLNFLLGDWLGIIKP